MALESKECHKLCAHCTPVQYVQSLFSVRIRLKIDPRRAQRISVCLAKFTEQQHEKSRISQRKCLLRTQVNSKATHI